MLCPVRTVPTARFPHVSGASRSRMNRQRSAASLLAMLPRSSGVRYAASSAVLSGHRAVLALTGDLLHVGQELRDQGTRNGSRGSSATVLTSPGATAPPDGAHGATLQDPPVASTGCPSAGSSSSTSTAPSPSATSRSSRTFEAWRAVTPTRSSHDGCGPVRATATATRSSPTGPRRTTWPSPCAPPPTQPAGPPCTPVRRRSPLRRGSPTCCGGGPRTCGACS